jgi:hypothetical protein
MEAAGDDNSARFRTDSRSWRLSVEKGASDDISFAGFEVDNAEALHAIGERLESQGIKVTAEGSELAADRGVLGLISCSDPMGTRVEIYYGATELFEEPFVSPTGVGSFLTGDQGLGHYVMAVPDIDASRRCDGKTSLPALQWPPPQLGDRRSSADQEASPLHARARTHGRRRFCL